MEYKLPEMIYTVEDINKAFSMGLETAILILESALFLSRSGQRQMIELLKERVEQDKIEAILCERPWITPSETKSSHNFH